jgi:hypothetical protein
MDKASHWRSLDWSEKTMRKKRRKKNRTSKKQNKKALSMAPVASASFSKKKLN